MGKSGGGTDERAMVIGSEQFSSYGPHNNFLGQE